MREAIIARRHSVCMRVWLRDARFDSAAMLPGAASLLRLLRQPRGYCQPTTTNASWRAKIVRRRDGAARGVTCSASTQMTPCPMRPATASLSMPISHPVPYMMPACAQDTRASMPRAATRHVAALIYVRRVTARRVQPKMRCQTSDKCQRGRKCCATASASRYARRAPAVPRVMPTPCVYAVCCTADACRCDAETLRYATIRLPDLSLPDCLPATSLT